MYKPQEFEHEELRTMAPRKKTEPKVSVQEADDKLLQGIVDATKTAGYMLVDPALVARLVRGNYVELNQDISEGDKVACRATEKGLNYFQTETKTETVKEEEPKMTTNVVETNYAIDDNVPMPQAKKRGGGKGRAVTYPFEQLQVNQSFHIAATEQTPNPAKARASLVSLWNNKFATTNGTTETVKVKKYQLDSKGKRVKVDGHFVEIGQELVERPVKHYSRKFAIVSVDEADPRGKGARIYRVA